MELKYVPIKSLRSQNSYNVLLLFRQAAAQNDRYYFGNDSQIDSATVTGIETHAHLAGVLQWDMPATMDIDGVTYNVITLAELSNMTLTVVNKKRQQVLSNMPFRALFNEPANTALGSFFMGKRYKKFILDVLSGESYITFNYNSTVSPPFVAPIEFLFDDRGIDKC